MTPVSILPKSREWFMTVFTAVATIFFLALPSTFAAEKEALDPSRIIQYRGAMPLLPRSLWGGEVPLKFELYRSPEGGTPFWKETRTVLVQTNGWVKVDLGEVKRLPNEAFTTPFRFLAIWHDNVEFTPRKQIASLAYVAALPSHLLAGARESSYATNSPTLLATGSNSSGAPARLDELIDFGSFKMEIRPRQPANWLQAVEIARKAGARLPTFEEWYGAYDDPSGKKLIGMEGHYEWVIPWVYEPTIHARLHELYRGKPVACYYEELSPMNAYPFRLALDHAAPQSKP
jgi:hypothetical protein